MKEGQRWVIDADAWFFGIRYAKMKPVQTIKGKKRQSARKLRFCVYAVLLKGRENLYGKGNRVKDASDE